MEDRRTERLYYGWIVAGVTALVLLLAAGARSSPGVFLLPMQHDLGYDRGTLSLAVSVGLVMFGLGSPLSGWLMDRFGPRLVTLMGLLLTGVSFLASAAIRSEWQLFVFWGLLSGVGSGVVGSVLGATVANRWFVSHRGLVTGLFGAATSAGQLIFFPLLGALADGVGWRSSALWIAGALLVCLVPAFLLMRDAPAKLGLRPLGVRDGETPPRITPDAGIMRRALVSLDFWLLTATFFICGATSNGLIGTHFIAHAVEHGMTSVAATGVLAIMGAFNFVGTIASGWLTDRFDPRRLLAVYYIFRGASLCLLPFVEPGFGLLVFAVLFGLDYIATVPPTTALVADTFGRGNVGTVFGWVFCAHQIGAATASWLGGVSRDVLGDYGLAFLVAAGVSAAGGLLALGIRREARPALAGD